MSGSCSLFSRQPSFTYLGKSARTVRNCHLSWGWTIRVDANLIAGIATHDSRLEFLDWYHLVENLYKVGGDKVRLARVEAFLWRGNVASAIAEFDGWSHPQVDNFIAYLHKHHSRIPDYWYFQTEKISSIGSCAIESTVKQIGRRVKISGAQWNRQNVPQVLFPRTAYLNGMLSTTGYLQN